MIASVKKPNHNDQTFRFTRIFGDHMHNLLDIQNSISPEEMIVVYQLDPAVVDRQKIQ